jgi:uracil phosphoribosyltransferase
VATPLILSNPIVADKVRQLRDERTSNETFLRLAGEISRFVAYEALADAPTTSVRVTTPVMADAPAEAFDRPYVIVPILRAGLGMSGAVQELVPNHRLCLLGLRRNEETLQPDIYLDGLPTDLAGSAVLLCDPMLATGGSLVFALDLLRARGAGEVTILCLIAAQAGLDHVTAIYPDVRVVAAALDPVLNEVGYITPGLGDAGDRLFGPPVR